MTPHNSRILIVDDEVDFAKGIARHLAAAFPDCPLNLAHSGAEALALITSFAPDIMLLDLRMPDMDGHQVLHEALKSDPNVSVIMLTAHGTVEIAVNSLRSGAWDFLTKPVRREELLRSVAKACERSRLLGENKRLTRLMSQSAIHRTLIGDSLPMRHLKESIRAVAGTNYTVLIQGESGTGKELVAESIHALSDRRDKPLVRVNCPAIPEPLLESELFGHAKGAFTGAVKARQGLFLEASGGALVLDEIGDIPLSIQTKLLRVLQDGEVRAVGCGQTTHADTRVIAVTNQDLEAKIKQGTFREDLYYRLNVLTLRSPALRERREDIPLLAAHFLAKTCEEMRIEEKRFDPATLAALCQKEWQGNVRELQNTIRRLVVFCPGPVIEPAHLSLEHPGHTPTAGADELLPYKQAKHDLLDTFTREYLNRLFSLTGGNVSEAARKSGLERVSLQKILRRLCFDPNTFRA